MSKTDLVAKLKADAAENGFRLEGDSIVFDKKSKLSYQVLTHFKLKELLTKNPLSKTVLNLSLLNYLDKIREVYGDTITIRASYASPEYHLTSFGAHDSDLYTTGNALSLGVPSNKVDDLVKAVDEVFQEGEVFIYPWGVHIGKSVTSSRKDYRNDSSFTQKIKNFISDHTMKNYLIIGAAAVAGWFFFLRKR